MGNHKVQRKNAVHLNDQAKNSKLVEAFSANLTTPGECMKKEAMLYEKLSEKKVHCYLCSHHCRIASSKRGFCGVRENIEGTLFTNAYGKVISQAVDPIEKKPLYHVLPGSKSFSIAAIGCNFRCGFCQNWQISQVDEAQKLSFEAHEMKPENIVKQAQMQDCQSISYTYTEPTIFFEYAYDTAKIARQHGLYNVFVTNGYMTKEALDTIMPVLNAANVDLKSFSDEFYKRNCKARLQPVLDSIAYMKELGIWVEVTTLIIPGQNDSEEELTKIANFIARIDVDIPWHLSRFFPSYRLTELPPTAIESLKKTEQIGLNFGLNHIYLGNIPEAGNTYCSNCGQLLISRDLFRNTRRERFNQGRCLSCNGKIPGLWA